MVIDTKIQGHINDIGAFIQRADLFELATKTTDYKIGNGCLWRCHIRMAAMTVQSLLDLTQ